MLSITELEQYARQFSLPEFGKDGQLRLRNSKVLCVGAGGLGSPALFYLAAAGVGTIGIVDADVVALSNLQRQVLYTMADIGKLKVDIARERLLALNPHIDVKCYPVSLTIDNALDIINQYDVVIDATDNYAARYLINDACYQLQKPDVFACILRFQGQCTVFATQNGPCYRCLFPCPPPADLIPSCAEAGVLGVLPGLMGSLQAIEVIKIILNIGVSLAGRLLMVDTLTMKWNEIVLARNSECLLCAKNTAFLELPRPAVSCRNVTVPEISIAEFKQLRDNSLDFFLLDVRERDEFAEINLGGYLIPLGELPERLGEIEKSKTIIVHCKTGRRSVKAVEILLKNNFSHVRNLKGGLMAWLGN
ncbi:MAG: molybdopterin-synthase adenylyltransferase MoeB [Gammaproteobacteria bacterium]